MPNTSLSGISRYTRENCPRIFNNGARRASSRKSSREAPSAVTITPLSIVRPSEEGGVARVKPATPHARWIGVASGARLVARTWHPASWRPPPNRRFSLHRLRRRPFGRRRWSDRLSEMLEKALADLQPMNCRRSENWVEKQADARCHLIFYAWPRPRQVRPSGDLHLHPDMFPNAGALQSCSRPTIAAADPCASPTGSACNAISRACRASACAF